VSEAEAPPTRLWLDDVRRPPTDEWSWAKSVEEAIEILATRPVVEASLDNDLHPFERDGLEVLVWMGENDAWPERIRIHTDNRFASTKMCNLLENNGYRGVAGRPRSFTRADGAAMSATDFAATSHRNSPKAMKRLR
jgi:hypothetical protein